MYGLALVLQVFTPNYSLPPRSEPDVTAVDIRYWNYFKDFFQIASDTFVIALIYNKTRIREELTAHKPDKVPS